MNLSIQQKTSINTLLINTLSNKRKTSFERVLKERTRFLTVVLEDVFQEHNASAVVRSCECFGVQDLHVIENRNRFTRSVGTTAGADKWIDITRWNKTSNNTFHCLKYLKDQNYHLVGLTLSPTAIPLSEIALDTPTALCIGTEMEGLSETVHNLADTHAYIPMHGFTQSFNLSVCTALCLYELTNKIRKLGLPWRLSKDEIEAIKFEWLKKNVKGSKRQIEDFLAATTSPV